MTEELLEIWDWETGRPTGKSVPRSRSHREGVPHEGVHLWLYEPSAEGVRIILQRRALSKDLFPGYLDISVGGHVPFGYAGNPVAKEAMEELGIVVGPAALTDLGYFRYEEDVPAMNLRHREFQHVWIAASPVPLDGFRFNDGEVDAVCSLRLDDFERILAGAPGADAWYSTGKGILERFVARDEFHPLFFTGAMDAAIRAVIGAIRKAS